MNSQQGLAHQATLLVGSAGEPVWALRSGVGRAARQADLPWSTACSMCGRSIDDGFDNASSAEGRRQEGAAEENKGPAGCRHRQPRAQLGALSLRLPADGSGRLQHGAPARNRPWWVPSTLPATSQPPPDRRRAPHAAEPPARPMYFTLVLGVAFVGISALSVRAQHGRRSRPCDWLLQAPQ